MEPLRCEIIHEGVEIARFELYIPAKVMFRTNSKRVDEADHGPFLLTVVWSRVGYVEPYRAGEGPTRENDLGPVAPAFVVTLEAGGRAVGDDETEDSTEHSQKSRLKDELMRCEPVDARDHGGPRGEAKKDEPASVQRCCEERFDKALPRRVVLSTYRRTWRNRKITEVRMVGSFSFHFALLFCRK